MSAETNEHVITLLVLSESAPQTQRLDGRRGIKASYKDSQAMYDVVTAAVKTAGVRVVTLCR